MRRSYATLGGLGLVLVSRPGRYGQQGSDSLDSIPSSAPADCPAPAPRRRMPLPLPRRQRMPPPLPPPPARRPRPQPQKPPSSPATGTAETVTVATARRQGADLVQSHGRGDRGHRAEARGERAGYSVVGHGLQRRQAGGDGRTDDPGPAQYYSRPDHHQRRRLPTRPSCAASEPMPSCPAPTPACRSTPTASPCSARRAARTISARSIAWRC